MRWTGVKVLSILLCVSSTSLSVGTNADQTTNVDWMLNCQGCHGASAVSIGSDVPPLAQNVARFLSVPGGREYLVRVPGVAMAPISDEAVASLTNWMLTKFDPEHIPSDFEGYTAAEVGILRKTPYIIEASSIRAQLMQAIAQKAATQKVSTQKELLSKKKTK